MVKRKIKDIWMAGTCPTILTISLEYRWWKFKWNIIKAVKVNPEITMEEINKEAEKLLIE